MSDGTVGLVQRRRRMSREEAKQLVGEYEASGLTRQAFCAGRGLSVAALDKYRRRHGQETASSEGRLVSVEVIAGASAGRFSVSLRASTSFSRGLADG